MTRQEEKENRQRKEQEKDLPPRPPPPTSYAPYSLIHSSHIPLSQLSQSKIQLYAICMPYTHIHPCDLPLYHNIIIHTTTLVTTSTLHIPHPTCVISNIITPTTNHNYIMSIQFHIPDSGYINYHSLTKLVHIPLSAPPRPSTKSSSNHTTPQHTG